MQCRGVGEVAEHCAVTMLEGVGGLLEGRPVQGCSTSMASLLGACV